MFKKLTPILLALILLLSIPVYAEGVTVVDGMGREITIATPPQTVVSLTPANTEVLYALGCGDKVVGVDNQSDYPAEAAALEHKVGDYYAPNVEAVVALKPDVVFASDKLQQTAVEQLTALGVTVICNDPTALSDVAPGIEMMAKVMGADPSAITGDIANRLAAAKTKVYFALTFGEYGNYTAGPGTFIDDMLTLLRCENVAGTAQLAWPEYTMEQLALDDPDVILVSSMASAGDVVEQLKQTPGFSELRCVKEGHVYAVDANITSRPGPRIGEAVTVIAEAVNNVR